MTTRCGVREEIDHGLATITLDGPPLNILTTEVLHRLTEALDRSARAPSVRLIQLRAAGTVFSAGVDIADHRANRVVAMMDAIDALFGRLETIAQPVLAAVRGAALGGGAELTLGVDLCWAAEGASFGQPEIRLGHFAPPASVLLPRRVGERRALELLLHGETITAREAERIGWVTRVFPDERFEDAVADGLQTLLNLSGSALALAKRAVREGRDENRATAFGRVRDLYLNELIGTDDAVEGVAAFLAKRAAVWHHR